MKGFLTGPKKLLPLWRGVGGGGLLAGKRRRPAAEDGVPPSLQIPPHATHTYCSLARLPPTHPFLLGALILQQHFQVRWRALAPILSQVGASAKFAVVVEVCVLRI